MSPDTGERVVTGAFLVFPILFGLVVAFMVWIIIYSIIAARRRAGGIAAVVARYKLSYAAADQSLVTAFRGRPSRLEMPAEQPMWCGAS